MRGETGGVLNATKRDCFDVICAGEALWNAPLPTARAATAAALRFQPGGGAVNAAVALAREGRRVGLATTLTDDTFGRLLVERVASLGVDVRGVTLAVPRDSIVFYDGTSGQVVNFREEDQAFVIPDSWSASVLLLSGLSPVVSRAAALCKSARAARRAGTMVVIDVNAKLHVWAGRDPRAVDMVLREADVVRFSTADLAVLGMDAHEVRSKLRPTAIFLTSNPSGITWVTGPFGELTCAPKSLDTILPRGAGDAFTAALCGELARKGDLAENQIALWDRALRQGLAAACNAGTRARA